MEIQSINSMFKNAHFKNNYFPFSVEWDITYRCPQSCVHCYQKHNLERSELSTNEIHRVIDQLNSLGTREFKLSGGDPMLRSDFFEIIEHLSSLNVRIVLYTSGVLLSYQNCERLQRLHVTRVETSLLGPDSATHDSLARHPGAFKKICEGICNLRELNIPQRVKYIQMRQNFSKRSQISNLETLLNIDIDTSNPYLWCPQKGTELEIEPYRLTPDEQKEYFKWNPKYPHTRAPVNCGAGRFQLGISADGMVLPCSAFTESYAVGNVIETSIEEIWSTSPFLQKLRREIRYPIKRCRVCKDKNFCVYCPAIASWAGGDISEPYMPMCEYASNARIAYELLMNSGI